MMVEESQVDSLLPVFAALADRTRLTLIERLSAGESHSIAELTAGLNITHQGVTKHLKVLEGAGLVAASKLGRERRYQAQFEELARAQAYLAYVGQQWDAALLRLKAAVEE